MERNGAKAHTLCESVCNVPFHQGVFYFMTTLEKLTRQYFKAALGSDCLYNHRPKWLTWKTGNPLELDIFYPKFKIAVEANGFQHKILPSQIEKDAFKIKVCKEQGVFLITIEKPQELLRNWIYKLIRRLTGRKYRIPFSLLTNIKSYEPKKSKWFGVVIHRKLQKEKQQIKYNAAYEIQRKEKEFNKKKIEARLKLGVS